MKRLAIIAMHFPEYCTRYAIGMSRYYEVMLIVDRARFDDEWKGRTIPHVSNVRVKKVEFKSVSDLFAICGAIVRFRPSYVHLQEAVGPRRGFFSACVAVLARIGDRLILTVHDPIPHLGRDADAAQRLKLFRDFVRRAARFVVVHGRYCSDTYRKSASPNQIVLVSEHGVILEPATPAEPHASSILSLLFFGRMEAYKGLDVLSQALESLHQQGVRYSLTVAGAGPELDRLRDRLDQLPEVTVIKRYIPAAELIELLQETDGVVVPYLSATQSGVAAAAFANGRFVVASDVGGLSDVIEPMKNGLLVPANDAFALGDAIKRLAEDSALRASLQRGARSTADGKLNWDRIADELHARLTA